jgi:hypothetical protein
MYFLDLFLKQHDILPKRMGLSIRPRLKSLILISPKSIITRPPEKKFDTSSVIKADTLRTRIDREVDKWKNTLPNIATLRKLSSYSTLMQTAKTLARFHKPKKIDFKAEYGLSE